jgi:hypothetical protein
VNRLGDVALPIQINALVRDDADAGDMLAPNQAEYAEQVVLTDQASAPPGQAAGGALEDFDVMSVTLKQNSREEPAE